jgi:PAS domain S-box-containing protein
MRLAKACSDFFWQTPHTMSKEFSSPATDKLAPADNSATTMPLAYSVRGLLLVLLLVSLVPLSVILAYTTVKDMADAFRMRTTYLHALAEANAATVGNVLARTRSAMEYLAQRQSVRDLGSVRCDPEIAATLRLVPELTHIATLRPDGSVVCSATPKGGDSSLVATVKDWLDATALPKRFSIGAIPSVAAADRVESIVTMPFESAGGHVYGVLAVTLDIGAWLSGAPNSSAAFPADFEYGVVRDDGNLVWNNVDPAQRHAATRQKPMLIRAILATRDGTVEGTFDGSVHRVFGVAAVPQTNLFTYIGFPTAAISADDRSTALQRTAWGMIMLLLACTMAVLVGRRIRDPIFALANTAQQLLQGNSAARASLAGTAETQLVGAALNRLVDAWSAAERRSAEAMHSVKDLYDHAPCGYHSVNADGIFVHVNETELRWLGYRRDEVIDQLNIRDLLTAECRVRFEEKFSEMLETGEFRDFRGDYLRKDGTSFPVLINATAVTDQEGRFRLSRTTVYDLSTRVELERSLEERSRRIDALSRQIVAVEEKERRRLSSELHDRTGANIAALNADLTAIGERLPQQTALELADLLGDCHAVIADTARSLREVCAELRPPLLDYSGLIPALESYAQLFGKRIGIATTFIAPATAARMSPEVESTLFRIAQEALTNCAKHAPGATSILIELTISDDRMVLTITDDGDGFDSADLGPQGILAGQGLLSMRERAEFIGGRFSVESAPGKGTRIRVERKTDGKLVQNNTP